MKTLTHRNNHKYDICCIGHVSYDKNITPEDTFYMPGGTAFYFSHAIRHFHDVDYFLQTMVGKTEARTLERFCTVGINFSTTLCQYSVYFENIYGKDSNERKQHVLTKADPFTINSVKGINASIIHLGTLLADDFSIEAIKHIKQKSLLSIDAQGFLRDVRGIDVYPVDWHCKNDILKGVHFLKVNQYELGVLTCTKNIIDGINILHEYGVQEIIATLGGFGSIIFDGKESYIIPAYKVHKTIDTTGCGDTYMAGYLYKRFKGCGIEDAGNFASAMAALKAEYSGPFSGTTIDIINCMDTYPKQFPTI
jgi:sugar/nucleoside kinase (ribokinase family)